MLKRHAGDSLDLPQEANAKYLEDQHREKVREIYETLHTSRLESFTFTLVDSSSNDLNAVLHALEGLPEAAFIELMQAIDGLREARNELRLARFLFDVEEINAVHRLIMRNKAVLRGRDILHNMLRVWPVQHD